METQNENNRRKNEILVICLLYIKRIIQKKIKKN